MTSLSCLGFNIPLTVAHMVFKLFQKIFRLPQSNMVIS